MGKSAGRRDGGFILVWALLLMVVLLILGVSGIGTSIFESMMTANDALHKQSFFQADGGANTAGMLIEENVSCPGGFASGLIPPVGTTVSVGNLTMYRNQLPLLVPPVSNANRDAFYFYSAADPAGTSATLQRTNIKTYATSKVLPGGPMEMGAGYEGKGFGLPGGGATVDYDTFSQYINMRQSQSIVQILWQHIIGQEGTCKY